MKLYSFTSNQDWTKGFLQATSFDSSKILATYKILDNVFTKESAKTPLVEFMKYIFKWVKKPHKFQSYTPCNKPVY